MFCSCRVICFVIAVVTCFVIAVVTSSCNSVASIASRCHETWQIFVLINVLSVPEWLSRLIGICNLFFLESTVELNVLPFSDQHSDEVLYNQAKQKYKTSRRVASGYLQATHHVDDVSIVDHSHVRYMHTYVSLQNVLSMWTWWSYMNKLQDLDSYISIKYMAIFSNKYNCFWLFADSIFYKRPLKLRYHLPDSVFLL